MSYLLGEDMATVEYKKLVMAGPMRWVVLTTDGEVTTLAWFVKVCYTAQGSGSVLFARSDLQGDGRDDIFAVFGDNLAMAEHLRDDVFSYTVFAGVPDQTPPAPIVEATFESQNDFPSRIVESMRAVDGTTFTLSLWDLGPPKAYVRAVNEHLTEVGAFAYRPSSHWRSMALCLSASQRWDLWPKPKRHQ